MAGPLAGIKVLDLTWVLSGPYATMILSDLGAEVIKVERPGVGDISRGNGPHINGVSTYFASLNRGKKSVVLDLSKSEGKETFLRLVEKVDVLVQNFTPGTMERMGLSFQNLERHNPHLIYAACSGFGQKGPYAAKPAFDIIVQAMGGILSVTGEPGGPPVRPGASLGDIAAGLFLCVAILACLQERQKSGRGQMIDLGMLDCQLAIQENAFVRYLNTGEVPGPLGTRHPVFTPFQVFPTKDSYLAIAMMGGVQDQWPLFCAIVGHVELADKEKYATGWLRTQNFGDLEPVLNEALKARTTQEWLSEFDQAGIACGPVNTIDMIANDPHVAAREMVIDVQSPSAGSLKVVGTPIKLSRTPCEIERSCPELGQHTEQVLKAILGSSQPD